MLTQAEIDEAVVLLKLNNIFNVKTYKGTNKADIKKIDIKKIDIKKIEADINTNKDCVFTKKIEYLKLKSSFDIVNDFDFCIKYVSNISKSFLKTISKADFEDIVVDSIYDSIEKIQIFDFNKGMYLTWLIGIVRKNCLAFIKNKRKLTYETDISSYYDLDIFIEDPMIEKYNEMIYSCYIDFSTKIKPLIYDIKNITVKDVMIKRELENMSYHEIADATNININTIKSNIRFGRRIITRKIQKELDLKINKIDII